MNTITITFPEVKVNTEIKELKLDLLKIIFEFSIILNVKERYSKYAIKNWEKGQG